MNLIPSIVNQGYLFLHSNYQMPINMKTSKVVLLSITGLIVLLFLILGLGYFGVFATKTVGKAQQNANREVFEQTQSYVEGKRQELIKDYHEWLNAKPDDKIAIEGIIRESFANFDEDKYLTGSLYNFLKKIKNQ
jgi:hypothetical protein